MTIELCKFCKVKAVAYPGARYCGAGCTARAEAHEKPPESPKGGGEEPPYELDAAEMLPFPSMAFARNPWEQRKYYPFMDVVIWPWDFR
jgi:hypothetical protein